MSKYFYNESYFKIIDTEEKAYWLGFLYADGCITRFYKNEKIKSMSLELALKSTDKEHLETFVKCLNSNVPIQEKTIKNTYKASKLVVNCTSMCRDLIQQGCTPQKSLTLVFPNSEILPKPFVKDFIRGYFDGDGCVHYSEGIQFYKEKNKSYPQKNFVVSFIGTKDFLCEMARILIENGININIDSMKNNNCGKAFELRVYGAENLKNLYEYMYTETNVSLKRKKEIFKIGFNKFNL